MPTLIEKCPSSTSPLALMVCRDEESKLIYLLLKDVDKSK
jgi:hypothetical protein